MTLIKSISGIRGTIGGPATENLTPLDIVKFTTAYVRFIAESAPGKRLKIVVGRDARISGEMVSDLVEGTLLACGADVINVGLCTTPGTEMAVITKRADGGIIITASLGLLGVLLNAFVPQDAFNIVMDLAGIGIAGTWMSILVTHWIFIRRAAQGLDTRPEYRLFGAPYTNAATIIFLLVVIVSMAFDVNNGGPWTLALFGLICLAMVIGWYSVRDRIRADKLDEIAIEEPADLAPGENS